MSDSKEFKWDDSLVREFIEFGRRQMHISDQDYLGMDIEKFKKSKQPIDEYEIVSFVTIGGEFFKLNDDGEYYYRDWYKNGIQGITLQECLQNKQLSIHSVKRNSDNEVFCLGDVIGLFGDYPTGSIDKFMIHAFDNTKISAYNNCGYGKGISHCKKAKPKQVLFTTEDGVEIFDKDRFYFIHDDFKAPIENFAYKGFFHKQGTKFFSSKDAAEQYILENKPIMVSYKEIADLAPNHIKNQIFLVDTLKDFFKSKINPTNP